MKKKIKFLIFSLLAVALIFNTLVSRLSDKNAENAEGTSVITEKLSEKLSDVFESASEKFSSFTASEGSFDYSDVPEWSGTPYYTINNNIPFFDKTDTVIFETYSELDNSGRCGVAYANICTELMPTEKRGEIGMVKPSGWNYNKKSNNNKYEFVDGKYLYNRCHLIGFQLAGENANEKNLITGTRYLNVEGMLPFENMVADYVKETENHVYYRVTPIFINNEPLCRGVLMEAQSVEDNDIQFCVFCYNVQPNVTINYETGENFKTEQAQAVRGYLVNDKTKYFHKTNCKYVQTASNKQRYVNDTYQKLVSEGYSPCKVCKPN